MICLIWEGFPQYAARCVGAFVQATDEPVVVVATIPAVPIKGMEECCRCPVKWIPKNEVRPIDEICGGMPRVAIVSGWGCPYINRLAAQIRTAKGKLVAMCDNNYMLDHGQCTMMQWLTEVAKMLRFRILIRNKFDAYFVPGKSGRRLLRFYGVRDDRVFSGLYSADASLFTAGDPLSKREKKLLFVGLLGENKNSIRLSRAFLSIDQALRTGWTLEIYGCGPKRDEIPKDPSIQVMGFVQPAQLAVKYKAARIFCLPSQFDHFGLVVHEATLSGCAVLLSNRVGAAEDLLEEGVNGYSFSPFSQGGIQKALEQVLLWNDQQFDRAFERSKELGARIDFRHFVNSVKSFCN